MEHYLKKILRAQKSGEQLGIYACCSANPIIIETVITKAKKDGSCVLIAATANQCDQFGGYTGMRPADFKHFCFETAERAGLDKSRLILGGDHLGPLTFADRDEEEAMTLAEELIRCYVSAGFTKIHLDTSMRLGSDNPSAPLSDETIAARSVRLAKTAQSAYEELLRSEPDAVSPVYVIGSEVPIPGGSTDSNGILSVTRAEDFKKSLAVFERVYKDAGMEQVFNNVVAFVVQPGVEEKDDGCVEYDRSKAAELSAAIKSLPGLVFECHSTDYQTRYKLRELVEDGFGILNVGPALTFAMREGLFALSYIEDELYPPECRSGFRQVLDEAMLRKPCHWVGHYKGSEEEKALKRKFSFSDRCRYYFADTDVNRSIEQLFHNLSGGVPLNLMSQFMPCQYTLVRSGELQNDPRQLVINRIEECIDDYLYATKQNTII